MAWAAFVIANTAQIHARQIHWVDTTSDTALEELRVLNGYDIDWPPTPTSLRTGSVTRSSPSAQHWKGFSDTDSIRPVHADFSRKWPTPTTLRQTGRARVTKLLTASMPRVGDNLARDVFSALDAQSIMLPTERVLGQVIAELAVELEWLYDRRAKLAEQIEEVFRSHPFADVLLSMPGIGPRTGARILAEIGHPDRFATGDKLAAYAGLAPVTRQSGKSISGETKSRRGNHRLKNAMFLAAFASLRSPDSRAFYDRKRAEGKKHNAAIVCLARRRCDVILAMIKTGQHYQSSQAVDRDQAA